MENKPEYSKEKKFSRYFLLFAFAASLILFVNMIKVFIMPIFLAVVMAIMVYPLFKLSLKILKGRRAVASLLTCIIVLIALLLPLLLISNLVIIQSIELYHTAGPQMEKIIEKGSTSVVGRIMDSYAGQYLSSYGITFELKPIIVKSIGYLSSMAPKMINRFSRTTAGVVFDLFIIMFSLFYFLKDGPRLLLNLRGIVPISEEHKDRIVSRFHSMSMATIKGILFVAFLQGFLATLTLWVFGVQAWLLWGIVMLVFSVIPFVGTGAVLVPAGIIKILMGDVFQGIAIILISVFFISLIDNVLRPRIIGQGAGMHDLLVFFSIIGGLFTFGPAGLIIGPLVAAIFLTVLEIYKIEFDPHAANSIITENNRT